MIRGLTMVALVVALMQTTVRQAPRQLLPTDPAEIMRAVSTSTPDEVSVAPSSGGVSVTCRPGKSDYPGIVVKSEHGAWDLSSFGHVEARITNTGSDPITVCLRVDNTDSSTADPWNAENAYPGPGETVTVRVRFGYSWGQRGYALNPSRVSELLVFTNRLKSVQSFRIESIVAGGSPGEKPPVSPEDVRIVPRGGTIVGAGMLLDRESAPLLRRPSSTTDTPINSIPISIRFTGGTNGSAATIRPPKGRWDLRDYLEVRVQVRNAGAQAVAVRARIESAPGVGPWVSAPAMMPHGTTSEIRIPFAGSAIELSKDGSSTGGTPFETDRASAVSITAEGPGEPVLELLSIRADVPPAPELPSWLGRRPPVPGQWKQTLDEEFTGPSLNEKLWTIYHPNYWDKQAHFSKQNVVFGGGKVRLRFEKRRGHENDDPAKPETDWATGFLTSTHKWTQLYGYFECRMKLPRAPGMWPAFWMMPDRGPSAGEAREDTRSGGMEFDILEYLARYGPYRYNIACHWDGYERDHRAIGTDRIYVRPDKDGFYTAGLLWEPGSATFYCNGQVVARWRDPRVCSVPMYILFTAVSGGWGGNTLTGEGLPSDYVLDYVRAWQRE